MFHISMRSSSIILLLTTLLSPALSFGPQAPSSSSSGCALIIPGPGRSSAFDHGSHVFGGSSFDYQGSNTCITYEAVNAAFTTALERVGLPPVRGKFTTDDVGNLGTVIHETSRYLAKQYGLSKDAISNGLPLIDTTKTIIEGYCPPFLMTPKCTVERYRSVNGMCNNVEHPHWGAAMNGHHRFLAPNFADGISAPRASKTGNPLPSARIVSSNMHRDEGFHDHAVTILLVAWGQFIDHDITLSAETKDPRTGKTPKCCEEGQTAVHPNCLPIEIPSHDTFFSKHKQRCMNFVRSQAGLRYNCRLGPRDTFNEVSSLLDAGTVYSNSEETLESLRLYKDGLLKMLPVFNEFEMKELLPLKLESPDEGCIRPSEDVYCFLAGDARVNEQTVLAMIHTLFAREHNRIAGELKKVNPHWNDETIFQETRHIIAALISHINYNEFLPMVLGKEVMQQHDLILLKNGYSNSYDTFTNPSASTVFVSAAFRFGHSLLPSTIERWSKTHRYIGSQRLSEMLQQPYDLYKAGWADNYLMGLVNQVAQALDDSLSQEVTNHLFQEPGKKFGLDLAALNMQRAREHGVPGYNGWREWCGLPKIHRWSDLRGLMSNSSVHGYASIYESPDDIDIWSAGITEKPLPGSMIGPTLACIIGKQFHNLRHGDRYWYENGGWPSSFTLEQLEEIRKIKFSRILCDNSDTIENMQVYAMVLPDHEINPRVPCKSGVLPRIDFSKWRDASYHPSPSSPYSPF
ncbi:LOW QUALITY PROTEIN: salivary peroxidase/catechol oxidase-like [Lepeophtheirus salmonis]|uniref:LOW QUALITY PROTEIN: salivary peroxidase/catechol oxidase-like n=1 Tax=Lepeophtheirus salmonis TaxID=72036 RepID=UPI001AE28808|nr:LOW QUALITY PROTEIN: peroxidase-like [Lepeophtheirus salmonis]